MTMEETRRRNEASMARKRAANAKGVNAGVSGASTTDGANSPSSTGAMDSLLEKLRAAAPQARDQRDRRRRARLKDRHQIRVASGQTMPEMSDLAKADSGDEAEKSILSPQSVTGGETTTETSTEMATISEGEDIADRAASMLQGLRGDGDVQSAGPSSRDGGSIRVRRRRESVDDERRMRRSRRRNAASSTHDDRESTMSPTPGPESGTIPEESINEKKEIEEPPRTVVSPPSPEGTARKPMEIEDD